MGLPGVQTSAESPSLMIQRDDAWLLSGELVTSCWPDPALILCPPLLRKYLLFFSVWESFMSDPHVTYASSSIRVLMDLNLFIFSKRVNRVSKQ